MAANKPAPKPANVTASAEDKPTEVSSTEPTPPIETKPDQQPSVDESAEPTPAQEVQDVEALLSRHTFDGKGDNAVPPSDFRGYATDNVEKASLKSVEEVAQEVLNGSWGPNAQVVTERLHAAGYSNINEIEAEYNRRVQKGAPKAF